MILKGRKGGSPLSILARPDRKQASYPRVALFVVIRMTPLPIGQNHHAGPQLAQFADNLDPVFPGILHLAVGEYRVLPARKRQESGRLPLLPWPALQPSHEYRPRPESGREWPCAVGVNAMRNSVPRTGLLHIVPMGGNGQHVHRINAAHAVGNSVRGVVVIARRVHIGHIVGRAGHSHLRIVHRGAGGWWCRCTLGLPRRYRPYSGRSPRRSRSRHPYKNRSW